MPDKIFKHIWLKLTSVRTQPYTIDDISIIIPSAAGRYEQRWQWFWPQYVAKTHPEVVKRTLIPCDPAEHKFLLEVTNGHAGVFQVEPRWIVPKTIAALDGITTRLTFRLANDILIVREGWEGLLLKQFNAQEKLQIIGELQDGISFPESHKKLARDWSFFQQEYPQPATAQQYPHGSRLFAQTAVWNGYYRLVLRYTPHEHDELFFSQLARGDGTCFTNWRGINLYLAHVGITNQDFTGDYISNHIEARRSELRAASDKHTFTVIP